MVPCFITCHCPPQKFLTFLIKMTQTFFWNSRLFQFSSCLFSWYLPGTNFLESKKADNGPLFLDSQFNSKSWHESMIFSNHFFNTFLMRLICCSHWSLWACFATQTCFPHFFLPKLLYSVLTSTHLSLYTAYMQRWMTTRRIFSTARNSIMAQCLNRTFSQSSILTCAKQAWWIAVGSRSCTVMVRHDVTARNQCFPVFHILIKNMTEKAKTFQPLLL